MSYLTLEDKGTPIAIIKGGQGGIISIVAPGVEVNKKCCKKCKGGKCKGGCCKKCCNDESSESSEEFEKDDLKLIDNGFYKKMNMPYRLNVEKFKKSLEGGTVKKSILKEAKKYVKERKGKDITIFEGEVQPVPRTDSRECIYIAGPSGSGKSTYTANYAREYKKIFPKNKIIVFSRVDHDDVIDKLKPIRILINDELIKDPISPNELANSLVIFDDTDTIPDKALKTAITNLKNDLLETGRHEDIYVAITSHLISNYRETRTVLNECHSITLFPAGGSTYSIKYVLKNYGGLTPNEVSKAISLPSRWVTLKKTFPQAILYSKGAYLPGTS
jgi:hypothetical protein